MRLPSLFLSKGVRWLVGLLVVFYLVDTVGRSVGWFSIASQIALASTEVWRGELWRVLSHAMLPAGLLELLGSCIMLVWMGGPISKVWSAPEFLGYCAICLVGAGIGLLLAIPSEARMIGGPGLLVVGVAVAWARLFGHERLQLTATFAVSAFTLALVIVAAMLLIAMEFGGWIQALGLGLSGASGWLYLSLRWKALKARPARAVASGRMDRLEL